MECTPGLAEMADGLKEAEGDRQNRMMKNKTNNADSSVPLRV